MTRFRRWLLLIPLLAATQLSAGCYLGYTNRPVLFPNVALSPAYVRPGTGYGTPCGPACYRPFGDGGSLLGGPGYGGGVPVGGPVYDAPMYGPPPAGCTTCGSGQGIPIAGVPGGAPIAVSPPFVVPSGGPIHGVPFDSGMVVPTVKPPVGSVPLQMPSELKEAKKLVSTTGK